MKIEIFQSSHGDCLLIESEDGKRMLCDGGMPKAMIEHVAPELAARREQDPDRSIDLVYVSHIDFDHIGGILELLEDALEWRVHEHHLAAGDDFAPPERPRPPKIDALWHNAFHDQVEYNAGRIEDMLAAAAPLLMATQAEPALHAAFDMQQITLGVKHALKVSKLAAPSVLGIPVNHLPGDDEPAKLLMVRDGQGPVSLGSLEIAIIGPTFAELKKLRQGWNNWLEKSREEIDRIDREIRKRLELFASGADPARLLALGWEGVQDFKGVTVPNIASLVLLVRENGKSLLLTGDAQQDILLDQLGAAGLLDGGFLHLDVLKVQHHGSEKNMNSEFARRVSADHYIFCGDGENGNPEPEVLEQLFSSRMSEDPAVRALAPEAQDDRRFDFWFSTSVDTPGKSAEARENFLETERLIAEMKQRSAGRLRTHLNQAASIILEL